MSQGASFAPPQEGACKGWAINGLSQFRSIPFLWEDPTLGNGESGYNYLVDAVAE
ncbi:hypothetical protein PGT21_031727 [Puccinia graminis f. sp. tritici]|uniref:Uncharacterized protein n=1 Tax=Puccinia graminis f. sp. tritici TaxID=56615 RepID=A0A5B0P7W7_PUCGR|nr:hypothetical protein PGT21_029972 [Puccinia graminis f. sp. tritici]KAA1113446.1 hypothetical protein PGT21_031727 [Puccinia graminis f. sp. tritici]